MQDLRRLCVDCFPQSETRSGIMDRLDRIIGILSANEIDGELWIDGSFLTRKVDPEDVDLVLRLESDFVERQTCEQGEIINWFNGNLRGSYRCDSYVHVEFQESHPNHWFGQWMRAYWMRQWGFDRDGGMKGIGVIELSGVQG